MKPEDASKFVPLTVKVESPAQTIIDSPQSHRVLIMFVIKAAITKYIISHVYTNCRWVGGRICQGEGQYPQ